MFPFLNCNACADRMGQREQNKTFNHYNSNYVLPTKARDFLRRKALFEKNCILTKDASKFDSEAVEGEEIKNFNNLRRKSTIHG